MAFQVLSKLSVCLSVCLSVYLSLQNGNTTFLRVCLHLKILLEARVRESRNLFFCPGCNVPSCYAMLVKDPFLFSSSSSPSSSSLRFPFLPSSFPPFPLSTFPPFLLSSKTQLSRPK